tara:strand:+ start:250 stop:354 length:105 start_codon:yes stop_codon:yes gene_type:complete
MDRMVLRILYYIAWAIGFFAVGVLIYGIVKSLGM